MEDKKEALGLFEKYLSVWVAICITLGDYPGQFNT